MESVILENDLVKCVILPKLGGKIASFVLKDKNFELFFQNKSVTDRIPVLGDDFANFDASGFDDAFPNIDAEYVMVDGRSILYPDHGEIWSAQFNYEHENDTAELWYESKILPYVYRKRISLTENNLIVDYEIKNTHESVEFPCIWTMHGLANCSRDMKILFPNHVAEVVNVQDSKLLGKPGTIHSYPKTKTLDGRPFYLDEVLDIGANNTNKYYAKGTVKEGRCGILYYNEKVHFELRYDADVLPYLGFWVTEGGFRGDYNCALEPSNGYYDSISTAKKNNCLKVLKPQEVLKFSLSLALSSLD